MRILQFIYELKPGGAERFVLDLSNSQSNLGHEVSLCVLRDDTIGNNGFYKKEISKTVNYINLKIPEGLRFSNIYRFYKVIKEVDPEVIHCHLNLVNYVFPLTFLFPKKKFFHTIHNDAIKEISNKIEFYLRRFFYSRSIVRAITISKDTSLSFQKLYKTNRYKEIRNGRSFPTTTEKLNEVKKEVQKPNSTSFIHVGRFSKQKNQGVLVQVFNKIRSEGYNVNLFIIGPNFDSPEAKKLIAKAGDHIHFLGTKHNIADYYNAADAFCLSSVHEGMPITLIEAFACGCVPICTPAGGVRNMIIDGQNGYLSNSFSEEDYCIKVKKFLNQKQKIDRNKLKDLFYSTYHMNVCATNYINVYLEKLSHGSEEIAIESAQL